MQYNLRLLLLIKAEWNGSATVVKSQITFPFHYLDLKPQQRRDVKALESQIYVIRKINFFKSHSRMLLLISKKKKQNSI